VIPFVDLKRQYASIRDEVGAAISSVLENSQFILGPEVEAFEQEFAAYCGARYAVGVNSGTSALHLALLAAGIGPGDEVITTPFTFVATAAAIYYTGAKPVYVDIDPRSFTIDPMRLEGAITHRTKAVLPVHLYGQTADMRPILEVARRNGLVVIEDAAQAHGAEYEGRRAGSLADLACFSFYPGKNLGACGEGGAITSNNPEYVRKIRMLRDWGAEEKYHHKLKGFNYRLEGLQAAILRVKLRHLEDWTEARRAHAALYSALLQKAGFVTPVELPGRRHVYHVYAIRTDRRDVLQSGLKAAGVQYGIHYPIPVHLQEAYREEQWGRGSFPHAEQAADEVLSLPMFAELTDDEIHKVCDEVAAAVTSLQAVAAGAGSRR
jgi:dTDP-4-amino-4,6-dideoxygalactose transaminase